MHPSIDVSVRDDGRTRDGGLRHPREIPLVRNKSARLPRVQRTLAGLLTRVRIIRERALSSWGLGERERRGEEVGKADWPGGKKVV